MKRIFLAAALTVACHHAMALTGITGNAIKKMCNGDEDGKFACSIWIDGIEHGLVWGISNQADLDGVKPDLNTSIGYCMNAYGVSTEQKQAIFAKYLNDHPAELHHTAASLVIQSMKQAFPLPCSK